MEKPTAVEVLAELEAMPDGLDALRLMREDHALLVAENRRLSRENRRLRAARVEDYVELLPPEVGRNRRHYRANIAGHVASGDCPCVPDEIPHAGPPVSGPALVTINYDW